MRIVALLLACLMLLSFTISRLTAVKNEKTVAHKGCLPGSVPLICWTHPVKASASHKGVIAPKKH